MINPQIDWLLLDGLLPLFGAALLYLLWGAILFLASNTKPSFRFGWSLAADPLGWLYGAVIIASQSAQKSFSEPNHPFAWLCVAGGIACLLFLMAAMTNRGAKTDWHPDFSFQFFTYLLVAGILWLGFQVRNS